MPDRAATAKAKKAPTTVIKNRWVASIVSLLLGLGLGTSVGREVLNTAGIPASCVRAIQRADHAVTTGKGIAADGKAALKAVTRLHFAEAGDVLGDAKDKAHRLATQASEFNKSRKKCRADRK